MRKIVFLLMCFIVICNNLLSQSLINSVKIDDIKSIKDYKGSINIKDNNGATPLMWAVYYSNLKMVKLLISKGGDPNIKGIIHSPDGNFTYGSCIVIAAGTNKLDILKYLIKNQKISVEDKEYNQSADNNTGWNALQWAAVQGHCDIIKYLIAEKANIDAVSLVDQNCTSLHFSASYNHLESTKLLVQLGASINAEDLSGNTPLDYAISNGSSRELIKFLYINGAKCKETSIRYLIERFKILKMDEL